MLWLMGRLFDVDGFGTLYISSGLYLLWELFLPEF